MPKPSPYLETVLASDYPIPDPLMTKYGVGGAIQIAVTEAVSVTVPISNLAAALILAEAYQLTDQRQKAIELLESLGAEASGQHVFALSLADLYFAGDQWGDLLRVTEGVTANEDDATLHILAFRAYGLCQMGLTDAALAVTKEALRTEEAESRPASIRPPHPRSCVRERREGGDGSEGIREGLRRRRGVCRRRRATRDAQAHRPSPTTGDVAPNFSRPDAPTAWPRRQQPTKGRTAYP